MNRFVTVHVKIDLFGRWIATETLFAWRLSWIHSLYEALSPSIGRLKTVDF
jgi:hypothetical protein